MQILVGTSGYAYKEWRGSFYPEKMKEKEMLRYYAERFADRRDQQHLLPAARPRDAAALGRGGPARLRLRAEGLAADHPPPAALRGVEGDGRLPLRRRLRPRRAARARALPDPALPEEGRRPAARLPGLPPRRSRPVAFEFRHETWRDEEVHEALRSRNAALVCADTEESGEAGAPIVPTADWGYLRLRRCDYDDAGLAGVGGAHPGPAVAEGVRLLQARGRQAARLAGDRALPGLGALSRPRRPGSARRSRPPATGPCPRRRTGSCRSRRPRPPRR